MSTYANVLIMKLQRDVYNETTTTAISVFINKSYHM